jgi:hypothetical protein
MLLAAAAAAIAMPATAQPTAPNKNSKGKVLVLVPLTLTKLDDLSFGDVLPSSTSSGSVTINATTGARSFLGGATGLLSDVGKRGYFGGAGSPGQQVFIAVTPPTELVSTTNNADKMPVLGLTIDGSPVRTVDPVTRTFFFGLGGTLQVNARQPEGLYEATFDVTAFYL